MLRVFLSQPLHLHHHARASSRRNLLTTNSKACHAFHSTPSPTSDAAPPTRPPPDDRGVAGGRGRPKLTSEAITERKALKEEFKPYDSNESGTDWYDQGRSMVCNIVPMFEDNYCFIILVNNGSKIVVDPAEPFVVKNALDRLHTEVPKGLEAIFTTHKHEDHTAGNFTLTNMYNGNFSKGHVFDSETEHQVKVYGPTDDGYISSMTHPVRGGDRFDFGSASGGETIGSLNVEIIDTPFHTSGSISYLCTKTGSPPALFCGDTLFVGGCGRFFEGTGQDMVDTFAKLKALNKHTEVYCGHEYTIANLQFALSIDPTNEALVAKYEWAQDRVLQGLPTIPTTIGDELTYNPFMRCDDPVVRKAVGEGDEPWTEAQVADKLREMKNNF